MTAFALTMALLTGDAEATTFTHPYSVAELSLRSEHVVVGEVQGMWVEIRNGMPWTVASVVVDDTLRGDELPVVQVTWPGGRVGEVELVVAGTPKAHIGEQGVFFIAEQGRAVGMVQGVFLMDEDQNLSRDLSAVSFNRGGETVSDTMSLEEIRRQVR